MKAIKTTYLVVTDAGDAYVCEFDPNDRLSEWTVHSRYGEHVRTMRISQRNASNYIEAVILYCRECGLPLSPAELS